MRIVNTFNDPNSPGPSYHLGIDGAYPNVITGGDPDRIEKLAGLLDDAVYIHKRGNLTVHGFYEGLPVTAFSTGMGPSSVCITLPEVIEACDDDDMLLLRIGTSGGLKTHLAVGDNVVTSDVFHDEGVSAKIMGEGYQGSASEDFRKVIEKVARRNNITNGLDVFVGKTVTTDVLYFDAIGDLSRYENSLAISMEFGVIAALRDWYNQNDGRRIMAGNLLRVSNMLVRSDVDSKVSRPSPDEIEYLHIKSGLDALVAMRRKR
ncbi:hypothetical protein CL619_03440 [archaeon]|nr:hypothetical protein [archaeon]|tara:strand:- start:1576 stop:2361 length:786 start_codon:yes stop_codon:yes gene_type:complete